MPLNQALDSNNAEMTKRLKYTKDILTHMLNNNQPNIAGARTASAAISEAPLNSNSSRRAAPITGGLNGVGSMSSVGNGEPMNGFNMPGPSSVVSSGGQVSGL